MAAAVTTAAASSSSSSPQLHLQPSTSTSSVSGGGGSPQDELSDPRQVREWLSQHHYNRQLAQLDKFLLEIRLGRLSQATTTSSGSGSGTGGGGGGTGPTTAGDNKSKSNKATKGGGGGGNTSLIAHLSSERRMLTALRTIELLRHVIGSTRWKCAAQLLVLLRGLGREFEVAGANRDPVIGNVLRRVMAAVREEAVREHHQQQQQQQQQAASGTGAGSGAATATTTAASGTNAAAVADVSGRLSLQSMLWALPQHVRSSKPSFIMSANSSERRHTTSAAAHQKQESFGGGQQAELDDQNESSHYLQRYPPSYYVHRPELKQSIMEAIQEMLIEMDDVTRNINELALQHIHSDEIILTVGPSRTIERFLKYAHKSRRSFQVVVCESAPHYGGHEMAKSLAESGIDTLVISDAAIFAMMPRVNKVLLPAHAVLANGGFVTGCGCNLIALAAHANSAPVVCVTGLFKLCPMYPHDKQNTLQDILSAGAGILNYSDIACGGRNQIWNDVEIINPVHDYIKPEHVSLYITNVGTFQPSFTYRLLAEYYHIDDWESFE